jgi:hypothetical protein
MDMRSDFTIIIDGKEFDFKSDTWQDAVSNFMSALNESGFSIDEERKNRIVEVATSGMVTVK